MTEKNDTIKEEILNNKSNNEASIDELTNSTILLKEYQPFKIGEYYFVIATTINDTLYFECKENEKYYKLTISQKNICIINDKFQTCKNIEEIYNLLLDSINKKQISITTIKNNKIKFNITITIDDTPSPFEILLKEEKNKNAVLLNEINEKEEKDEINDQQNEQQKKKNDFILIKDNYIDSESKNEKSGSIQNGEESQEIKDEIPVNHNHNIEFNLLEYDLNAGEKKNNINNNENLKESQDEDDDEEEENDEQSETTNNKEKEINKIYNIINELKNDIKYIKGLLNNESQIENEGRIRELEKKNTILEEEISKIKMELKTILEVNKKENEDINNLKNKLVISKPSNENEIKNSEESNTIGFPHSNNQLIKSIIYDDTNNILKSSSRKKIKKKKKLKSKSQRKSVIFNSSKFDDNTNGINVFIFKQKYKIKENEVEIDLTNRIIGDKGLETLSQIRFQELKTLSLDTNCIFTIKPLTNLILNHLQVLNLDNNNISNISFLEYVKFPSLQILWLNNNNIIDISVFERVKFNQLLHLYLNNNNITDISVFKKAFLCKLERLYLKNNKIEDISCLADIDMNKLNLIYLNKNRIDFNVNTNKDIIKKLKKKIKYLSY